MLDRPSGEKLLEAVIRYLRDEVVPALDGAEAFRARVAANALDIVRREMAEGARAEADEAARLAALLGAEGDAEALNRRLCEAIRRGEAGLGTEGLAAHLWATTLDKLAIDQPRYASYRRALEDREGQA